MDSRLYWIWLQAAVPLGHRAAGRILEDGRRPEAIHAAGEKELAAMGLAIDTLTPEQQAYLAGWEA